MIDDIYTNNPEKLSNVQSIVRGESDHKIISVVRHSKNVIISKRYTKTRAYKNFDEQQFCNAVKKISWWSLYETDDVNVAVSLFTEKISRILDTMAPVRVFQTRRKYVPWLSTETKSLMTIRDNLLIQAQASGCKDQWDKFKKVRNKVTGKLRTDKDSWERKSLNE